MAEYTNREVSIALSCNAITLKEALENLGWVKSKSKRGNGLGRPSKLDKLKAEAGGKKYLLKRDKVGYELCHVATGLISKFYKNGQPRAKQEIDWVKRLDIHKLSQEITFVGTLINVENPVIV